MCSMHEELLTNQDVMAAIWNKDGIITHVNEVQDHSAVRYFEKNSALLQSALGDEIFSTVKKN
jgi:hypothetical protein